MPDDRRKKVEEAEERHFQTVKSAFAHYQTHTLSVLERMQPCYGMLEGKFRDLLPDMDGHFAALKRCAVDNAEFLLTLSEAGQHDIFLNQENVTVPVQQSSPTEGDLDKVRSVLRHLVRDWSKDGAAEREQNYSPILRELEAAFPTDEYLRGDTRILVPGAGLGRLAWEIQQRGFCVQGNEISYFMLIASDFVFNRVSEAQQYSIYPFIHQTTNVRSRSDALREVRVPDISPIEAADHPRHSQQPGDFSMVAGDFTEVYTADEHEGKWQACVTCFFLDTGKNIFEYIEAIYHILPPGGHWINLGPLLYHFSEVQGEACVELALDDLRQVITAFGFDIVREDTLPSSYNGNPRSLLQVTYHNAFFHAVKTGRPKQTPGGGVLGNLKKISSSTRPPLPKEVFPQHSTVLASGPG